MKDIVQKPEAPRNVSTRKDVTIHLELKLKRLGGEVKIEKWSEKLRKLLVKRSSLSSP